MALINEALPLDPLVAILGYTDLARLQQAGGNTTAALTTLDALAHLAKRRHFSIHLMPQVAAVRAQLELAVENAQEASRILRVRFPISFKRMKVRMADCFRIEKRTQVEGRSWRK